MAFSQDMRLKAGAIFAARNDKVDFVPYGFVGYKGEFCLSSISHLIHNPGTVHGFACRPSLAYEEIKAGFEGSLSQMVEWFQKTLAS